MRVRMLIEVSGFNEHGRWPDIGGETVVGDVVGAKLVANGYAEEIAAPKPVKRTSKKTAPSDD